MCFFAISAGIVYNFAGRPLLDAEKEKNQMKNIDDKNPMFLVPEMFGNAVMSWARAEYSMGIIVQRFSSDEKILAKFNNPKNGGPNTWTVIEELKQHTREEYEQFILEGKNALEFFEKVDMQVPGEYTGKNFDAFIDRLHAARCSRNALAHEICKMELEHRREMFSNALKTGALPGEPAEMIAASMLEHIDRMLTVIGAHMEIISHVATPTIMFAVWLQDTNRMPPPTK